MFFGGDGALLLAAEEDDFVAGRGGWNVGYVDDGLVHGDAADDGGSLAVDEDRSAIGECAVEPVRVANGEQGDAHGFGGDEGAVIADDLAGREVADAYDAGLPGEDGLELRADGRGCCGFVGKKLRRMAVESQAWPGDGLEVVMRAEIGELAGTGSPVSRAAELPTCRIEG